MRKTVLTVTFLSMLMVLGAYGVWAQETALLTMEDPNININDSVLTDSNGPLYELDLPQRYERYIIDEMSTKLNRSLGILAQIEEGEKSLDKRAELVKEAHAMYNSVIDSGIRIDTLAEANDTFKDKLIDCKSNLCKFISALAEEYYKENNFDEAVRWFDNLLAVRLSYISGENMVLNYYISSGYKFVYLEEFQKLARECHEKGNNEGYTFFHKKVVEVCKSFCEQKEMVIDKLPGLLNAQHAWIYNLNFEWGESLYHLGEYKEAVLRFMVAAVYNNRLLSDNIEKQQQELNNLAGIEIILSVCYEKSDRRDKAWDSFEKAWEHSLYASVKITDLAKRYLLEEDIKIIDDFVAKYNKGLMREMKGY